MRGATASTSAPTRTRDVLPLALSRDFEGWRGSRTQSPAERPTSIKEAVIRWLNEEL